jgi:hypothetical protein
VSRFITASVLGWLWLAPSQGFSQTRDRRLDEALVDITLLKRLVKEQDRRIADLEKTVKALQAPPLTGDPTKAAAQERVTPIVRPSAARWLNPLAWGQIREGLSRAQVEEILGPPTSVESVIDYQTLIYKGEIPGARNVGGAIKLTDDRVSQITLPEF